MNKYNKEKIESSLKNKGYVWFNDDNNKGYDLNIVSIRNSDNGNKVTNIFDDVITVSFKIKGEWIYKEWINTTDPGTKGVKEFHNVKGVARLVPGQYRGSHIIGLHQGKYEALKQLNPVKVYRDFNKDLIYDEVNIDEGVFGINIHKAGVDSTYVENWSEGCQVFKRVVDFDEFMTIIHLAAKIHGSKFTYTLLESKDIKQKTILLNLDKLKGHIPDLVINQIPDTSEKFEINTPLRLAHFLAQCGHESIGFKAIRENLNYSIKGLNTIFKKYFPTEESAKIYERNPEKIASKVYGNRMGNGDEISSDGYKFRGRGYIQLTGKDNYTSFGKSINEDLINNPDKVATHYPLLSAAWFFQKNGLNQLADNGSTDEVITQITKRVNGGIIGLPDRIIHFKEYYNLLK